MLVNGWARFEGVRKLQLVRAAVVAWLAMVPSAALADDHEPPEAGVPADEVEPPDDATPADELFARDRATVLTLLAPLRPLLVDADDTTVTTKRKERAQQAVLAQIAKSLRGKTLTWHSAVVADVTEERVLTVKGQRLARAREAASGRMANARNTRQLVKAWRMAIAVALVGDCADCTAPTGRYEVELALCGNGRPLNGSGEVTGDSVQFCEEGADDDGSGCLGAGVALHWRNRPKGHASLKRGARLPVTARIVDVDFGGLDPVPLRAHGHLPLRLTVE